MGKEPELVFDTERYWLDIVGLTSLLYRGWTPSQSGSALGERQGGGVGILASPWIDGCLHTEDNHIVLDTCFVNTYTLKKTGKADYLHFPSYYLLHLKND